MNTEDIKSNKGLSMKRSLGIFDNKIDTLIEKIKILEQENLKLTSTISEMYESN